MEGESSDEQDRADAARLVEERARRERAERERAALARERQGEVPAEGKLVQLEQEERAISKRRRQLHNRIDSARAMGDTSPEAAERLAFLLKEEREISDRRRELHRQIDELRAKPR